ncbi:MAG: hypothetical protein IPQ13_08485 [Holophagaceae bacterium]|nr:hypothetical protein [Holophagaceae bacterium]
MDFLDSLEGAKVRSDMELCILEPGSQDTQRLIEKQGIQELPAIFLFRAPFKSEPSVFRSGKEALSWGKTFEFLLRRNAESLDPQTIPTPSQLKARYPDIVDPDLFIKFVLGPKAKQDYTAAMEPYRGMLVGLLKSSDMKIKGFAASRLVEANASYLSGEPNPFHLVLRMAGEKMIRELSGTNAIQSTNGDQVEAELENGQYIASNAPCWTILRSRLKAAPRAISTDLYALMAPQLVAEDRSWILPCFKQGAILSKETDPWDEAPFWLGVDWLLCYGEPADWQLFASVLDSKKRWSEGLATLQKSLEPIPAYWKVSPRFQGMFCEGTSEDAFWKAPDACLAEWGVTRQNLIELSMDEVQEKQRSVLRYPGEARERQFWGSVRVQILIGTKGEVKAARPLPGHALAFFAPEVLRFATACTFEPATVAGVKRPSRFIYRVFFRRPGTSPKPGSNRF